MGLNLDGPIKKNGFTFLGVFDPEGKTPMFVYSVGLTGRGWPEVLLVGNMNPKITEIILTDIIKSWEERGEPLIGDNHDIIRFADGTPQPLRVREASEAAARDYAVQARFYYNTDDIKVVQVMWPDTDGKFPDDQGYNTVMQQPII